MKEKVVCPVCKGTNFDSNRGKVNFTLTYVCRACGESIDVGSCDSCDAYVNIDTITDEAPFLCQECQEKKEKS